MAIAMQYLIVVVIFATFTGAFSFSYRVYDNDFLPVPTGRRSGSDLLRVGYPPKRKEESVGDINIYQHIHEYVWDDLEEQPREGTKDGFKGTRDSCKHFCTSDGFPFESFLNGNCQCASKAADCSMPDCKN